MCIDAETMTDFNLHFRNTSLIFVASEYEYVSNLLVAMPLLQSLSRAMPNGPFTPEGNSNYCDCDSLIQIQLTQSQCFK